MGERRKDTRKHTSLFFQLNFIPHQGKQKKKKSKYAKKLHFGKDTCINNSVSQEKLEQTGHVSLGFSKAQL